MPSLKRLFALRPLPFAEVGHFRFARTNPLYVGCVSGPEEILGRPLDDEDESEPDPEREPEEESTTDERRS